MWTAICSVLAIIIGLWKWWRVVTDGRKKKQDAKIKETTDAIKNGDTSTITANLS